MVAVEDEMIAAALQLIRENACSGIRVADVLDAVPVSRSKLERDFRDLLGRSPNAEIRRVQLDRVRQLLVETDLNLAALAAHTGFTRAEYLHVFKEEFGQTPGQFRRRPRLKNGDCNEPRGAVAARRGTGEPHGAGMGRGMGRSNLGLGDTQIATDLAQIVDFPVSRHGRSLTVRGIDVDAVLADFAHHPQSTLRLAGPGFRRRIRLNQGGHLHAFDFEPGRPAHWRSPSESPVPETRPSGRRQ